MIERSARLAEVRGALHRSRVVSILGPRQCGKTTLAREIAEGRRALWFDLEDPVDRARLSSPTLALGSARGLVVMDEIQRMPELFEALRVLVDRPGCQARFLILGSAAPDLVRGVSESLAGRVIHMELGGFDLQESGAERFQTLWTRGGLPRSFAARSEAASMEWREHYIRDFLERDIPQLGITIPAPALRRFWTMVAHFHGGIWNAAEFARSLGTSEGTARRYVDILTSAFVVRQLQPWHENLAKRQVKSPKIFIRDTGLLHTLLALRTHHDLLGHSKYGASWEGFAVEQVLALLGTQDAYFWATHQGAELDLLVMRGGRRIGFEMKAAGAPVATKSMHIARQDLGLDRLLVVHPGKDSYPLEEGMDAVSIWDLAAQLKTLKARRSAPPRGPVSP